MLHFWKLHLYKSNIKTDKINSQFVCYWFHMLNEHYKYVPLQKYLI